MKTPHIARQFDRQSMQHHSYFHLSRNFRFASPCALALVTAVAWFLFEQSALGQAVTDFPQKMPVSTYRSGTTSPTLAPQTGVAPTPLGTISPLPPLTADRHSVAQRIESVPPGAASYSNGSLYQGSPGDTWIAPSLTELQDFDDPTMSGQPTMYLNPPAEPVINGFLYHGYSGWRGISEGSGNNNNGFSYGGNLGAKLGPISDFTGIGFQAGASYGLYDLNGRASGFAQSQYQQQTFITVGMFRKADDLTNFAVGVVYDSMINEYFGQFANSPYLGQVRAQIAYCWDERHELGFWTALRTNTAHRDVGGPVDYRGVDQFNLFWHRKFDFGGDSWAWFGFPDASKIGGNGTLGSYLWGGTLTVPLAPRWGAYTDVQYMAPSAHTGVAASMEETFYLGLGVFFYPGRNSRQETVMGQRWMPYMPLANNGLFMVDTNRTF